ncbi:hypothetical protein F0267_26055 [Vibrio coralliilyticus]|uniref:hypothetical protein n=1 Tax=Vibrio TaxID=662 RepID=UPI00148B972E|nr:MULTISPECIES: hypothetical protein [Vibrio]NOH26179.1 hypothetical protein [Vibrio europaeus]NOH41694.1 hypothetical protein [Vibrio coralliilyticus]
MSKVIIYADHMGGGVFGVAITAPTEEALRYFTIDEIAQKDVPAPEWIFKVPDDKAKFAPQSKAFDGQDEIDYAALRLDANREFIIHVRRDSLSGAEIHDVLKDDQGSKIKAEDVRFIEYGYKIIDESLVPKTPFHEALEVDPALLTDGKGNTTNDFPESAIRRVNAKLEAQQKEAARLAAEQQAQKDAEAIEQAKQQLIAEGYANDGN